MSHVRYYLPTAPELRAMWTRYRVDRAPATGDRPPSATPDQDLVDLVDSPYVDTADVRERLADLESHLRAAGDRRSVFLTVYTEMTAAVIRAIDGDVFADPAWVGDYLVGFANDYREALLAFERGDLDRVPRPWRLAFGASVGGDAHVLQDALLGINAHINYDLPYTLHDLGIDPDRPAKRADHDRINRILRRLVDVVQDALVEVYAADEVGAVDAGLGRSDEELATLGLRGSRDLAWHNAVLLTDARWPWVRDYVDWRVRTVATGGATAILGAGPPGVGRPDARGEDRPQPTPEAFQQAFRRRASDANPTPS